MSLYRFSILLNLVSISFFIVILYQGTLWSLNSFNSLVCPPAKQINKRVQVQITDILLQLIRDIFNSEILTNYFRRIPDQYFVLFEWIRMLINGE